MSSSTGSDKGTTSNLAATKTSNSGSSDSGRESLQVHVTLDDLEILEEWDANTSSNTDKIENITGSKSQSQQSSGSSGKIASDVEDRSYKCIAEGCALRFVLESLRIKHIRQVHSELLKFKCDICGIKFETLAETTLHKRKKHRKDIKRDEQPSKHSKKSSASSATKTDNKVNSTTGSNSRTLSVSAEKTSEKCKAPAKAEARVIKRMVAGRGVSISGDNKVEQQSSIATSSGSNEQNKSELCVISKEEFAKSITDERDATRGKRRRFEKPYGRPTSRSSRFRRPRVTLPPRPHGPYLLPRTQTPLHMDISLIAEHFMYDTKFNAQMGTSFPVSSDYFLTVPQSSTKLVNEAAKLHDWRPNERQAALRADCRLFRVQANVVRVTGPLARCQELCGEVGELADALLYVWRALGYSFWFISRLRRQKTLEMFLGHEQGYKVDGYLRTADQYHTSPFICSETFIEHVRSMEGGFHVDEPWKRYRQDVAGDVDKRIRGLSVQEERKARFSNQSNIVENTQLQTEKLQTTSPKKLSRTHLPCPKSEPDAVNTERPGEAKKTIECRNAELEKEVCEKDMKLQALEKKYKALWEATQSGKPAESATPGAEEKLAKAMTDISMAKKRIQEITNRNEELGAELHDAKRNIDLSKTQHETIKTESGRKLEDLHNTYKADLAREQVENLEIKMQVKQLRDRNTELEAELGEARRNLDVSKTELDTMKMESGRMLEDLINTIAEHSSEADLVRAQLNTCKIKMKEDSEKQNKMVHELALQLEERNKDCSQFKQECDSYKALACEKEAKISTLKTENESLKLLQKSWNRDMGKLKISVKTQTNLVSEKERTIAKLQDKVSNSTVDHALSEQNTRTQLANAKLQQAETEKRLKLEMETKLDLEKRFVRMDQESAVKEMRNKKDQESAVAEIRNKMNSRLKLQIENKLETEKRFQLEKKKLESVIQLEKKKLESVIKELETKVNFQYGELAKVHSELIDKNSKLKANHSAFKAERAALEGKVSEAQSALEKERQTALICKSTADRDLMLAKQEAESELREYKGQAEDQVSVLSEHHGALVREMEQLKSTKARCIETAVTDFQEGDTVFFLYDEEKCNYLVADASASQYQYYLTRSNLAALGLSTDATGRKPFALGQITKKQLCEARNNNNRMNVPEGSRFYRVNAQPVQFPTVQREVIP